MQMEIKILMALKDINERALFEEHKSEILLYQIKKNYEYILEKC